MKKRVDKRRPSRAGADRASANSQKNAPSIKIACKALLFTVAIGLGILLVASLLVYFYKDPAPLLLPIGLLASALTAFLGGMVAGRMQRRALLASGLLNGVLFCVLMLLLSPMLRSQAHAYSSGLSALMHAVFLLLSVLGALSAPKKPTKRKRKRA